MTGYFALAGRADLLRRIALSVSFADSSPRGRAFCSRIPAACTPGYILLSLQTCGPLARALQQAAISTFGMGRKPSRQHDTPVYKPSEDPTTERPIPKVCLKKCVFVPDCRNEDAFLLQYRSFYTVTGLMAGLMISLQSKSPRSRPWIRISAVAALVAKGMLYWSHIWLMYFRSGSRSLD